MSIAFSEAKKAYAALNVDVEKAFARLAEIPVSLHCWQGDDNDGFEGGGLDGGILVTGNYPGKPTSPRELRNDMELAFSLIPGKKRIALHSIYAETGGEKVARNELRPEHFANWMRWAKDCGIGLDFNPTFYSHEQFKNGMTLSHPDVSVRKFWIEHGIACRKIGEAIGRHLGTPCVNNFWIPDGFKDTPFDRYAPRKRLEEALDEIFAVPVDEKYNIDSVESKLFGIGVESCSVGSHEFYLGYAVKNKKLLCLDSGHFHPTEVISDKISSCLLFVNELLLHVSRGVRWDSDHVVTLSDELEAIASEVVRHNFDSRVHIGLDFFDGSINRVAAWVIGARNMFRALLLALLEPAALLRDAERRHDNTERLVLLEEMKSLPFGAVWEEYCRRNNVPENREWLEKVRAYEAAEFPKRVRK